MPTPSGQISLNDIFTEPNPGWTGTESFGRVAYESWVQGPLGSNTYTSNGWGGDGSVLGSPPGSDAIYNTGAPLQRGVNPINFANYSNKYYYFDGTVYNIQYSFTNNVPNIPFPPPPVINDVNVQVWCYDYNMIYQVHPSFNFNAPGGVSVGTSQIPGFTANSYPLVENVYWQVQFNTNPGNTIARIDFYINGNNVYTAGGGGGGLFTWQSPGAARGYTNGTGIVYDVQVN